MHRLSLYGALVALLLALAPVSAAPGKFYIIGMGTSPDLVTVRGDRILRQADLFIVEDDSDRQAWKEYIGDKEVWVAPHGSRVGYGIDPNEVKDPDLRQLVIQNAKHRQEAVDKIRQAVEAGKTVVAPCWGDAMVYGTLWYLEMLPKDFPSEVIPGVGAFEAGSAALKKSTTFGWDTNSVILTMGDFVGRVDTNEKLMRIGTSLVIYTMHLDYPKVFGQLKRHYPANTPVAVVCYAGDPEKQKVIYSTVGRFLSEVDYQNLPADLHILFVGKFLEKGQARIDGLIGARRFIERQHGSN
jgi:precorrin-4/cobalt-precorrin-4 C11-methyltransferase